MCMVCGGESKGGRLAWLVFTHSSEHLFLCIRLTCAQHIVTGASLKLLYPVMSGTPTNHL